MFDGLIQGMKYKWLRKTYPFFRYLFGKNEVMVNSLAAYCALWTMVPIFIMIAVLILTGDNTWPRMMN